MYREEDLPSPTRTISPSSLISCAYRKPICCSPDTRESCSCFSSNSCCLARALRRLCLMCFRSSEPAWKAETTALTAATTYNGFSYWTSSTHDYSTLTMKEGDRDIHTSMPDISRAIRAADLARLRWLARSSTGTCVMRM